MKCKFDGIDTNGKGKFKKIASSIGVQRFRIGYTKSGY